MATIRLRKALDLTFQPAMACNKVFQNFEVPFCRLFACFWLFFERFVVNKQVVAIFVKKFSENCYKNYRKTINYYKKK